MFVYNNQRRANDGLTYYWPVWGNTKDTVGNVHLTNGVNASLTTDRFNNSNSAISLKEGYYTLPSGVYINGSCTVSVWIKAYKMNSFARVFDFGGGETFQTLFFAYTCDMSGRPCFRFYNYGTTTEFIQSNTVLRIGVWEFVCFVVNETMGSIYLNGKKVAESVSYRALHSVRTKNYLGKSNWNDGLANADFDELKIFNRALSQNEILQEMYGNMSYITRI